MTANSTNVRSHNLVFKVNLPVLCQCQFSVIQLTAPTAFQSKFTTVNRPPIPMASIHQERVIDLNSKWICNSFLKMKKWNNETRREKKAFVVAKPGVSHSCVSGLLKRSLVPTPTFPRPGPKLQSRTKSALSSSFWTSSKSRLGRRDLQPRGLYSTSGKVSSTTSFQNF